MNAEREVKDLSAAAGFGHMPAGIRLSSLPYDPAGSRTSGSLPKRLTQRSHPLTAIVAGGGADGGVEGGVEGGRGAEFGGGGVGGGEVPVPCTQLVDVHNSKSGGQMSLIRDSGRNVKVCLSQLQL